MLGNQLKNRFEKWWKKISTFSVFIKIKLDEIMIIQLFSLHYKHCKRGDNVTGSFL